MSHVLLFICMPNILLLLLWKTEHCELQTIIIKIIDNGLKTIMSVIILNTSQKMYTFFQYHYSCTVLALVGFYRHGLYPILYLVPGSLASHCIIYYQQLDSKNFSCIAEWNTND